MPQTTRNELTGGNYPGACPVPAELICGGVGGAGRDQAPMVLRRVAKVLAHERRAGDDRAHVRLACGCPHGSVAVRQPPLHHRRTQGSLTRVVGDLHAAGMVEEDQSSSPAGSAGRSLPTP